MSDPLGTYINDHLSGSAYAIDLVEFMRDTYSRRTLINRNTSFGLKTFPNGGGSGWRGTAYPRRSCWRSLS
jgi:hypothetical protein